MSPGVVIAGGGLAGQRCAETLRRSGYEGRVRMICAEPHRPYDRPALSKEALSGGETGASLSFRPQEWYERQAVELTLGTRARTLDPCARLLRLSDGEQVRYEHLLIATGSAARTLPMLNRYSNVSALRTLEDALQLDDVLRRGGSIAIIGAGFIGGEVAVAARKAGVRATIIETEAAPLARVLGRDLGNWFAGVHRLEGVDVRVGTHARAAAGADRIRSLLLSDGTSLDCDHVLVGVGVRPALDWLEGSGLEVNGVRTDVDGRASAPGVFAAGDAAATWDPLLARHVVGNHWEAAARQGARAAKSMLGLDPGAPAPTSFWTDLYGTRVQYIGHAAIADETRLDGDPSARDFTATFLRRGAPVGGLLVGRPQQLPALRALLTNTSERMAA